ncbi:MAG: tetratricopeptide repeat protein [Cyclobacteriaceae bacterium]
MKYALLTVLFAAIVIYPLKGQTPEALISKAEERLNHDDWVGAVKDFKQILNQYQSSLSPLQKGRIYNDLGYLNMRLLNTEEAEYNLNLSIINHEEAGIPDKINYAHALQNMSQLFLERVQYDLAKNYIDQAIEVIVNEKGRDNADYALARTRLARIYEEVGYYDLAYDIYSQSHDALKNLGAFSPDYAEACNHMGRILIRQGNPSRAEEYINESTVIYKQLGNDFDVERAESLEGLGNFYEQLGRYEEAEKTLLEALEIKRTIPNEANILIIETLNDLGILYRHLGDDKKSEKMFQEVIKECEKELTTDHPFYATAKNNLATIAMQNEDTEKAKTLLEEALATYDKKYGPNHPLSANTLNNLARVQRQMGNDELAEDYYKRVLSLDEKLYGKLHPDYATTLMNLAILYSSSGRDDEADRYYEEALTIRKEVLGKNHPSYYRALENVGLHSMARGRTEDAEVRFREAIEIQIEHIQKVFPALSLREKELFYERLREDVDRYNFIAFGLIDSRPELIKNIFDYQLKTKAILFTPTEKVENRIVNGNDPKLRNTYFKWREDKQLLANYYRIGSLRLQENSIDLNVIETEIKSLENTITSQMPDFEDIIPRIDADWNSIQQKVTSENVIVEIVKIREFKSQSNSDGIIFGFTNLSQYLAIIFKEGSANPTYAVLGDRFRSDESFNNIYKNSEQQGSQAFNELWEPIHKRVGKATRVIVSPDGIFNEINPNALRVSGENYVIDEYFVNYVTSCTDLLRTEVEVLTKKTLLFGNPDFRGSATEDRLRLAPLPNGELQINSLSAILQPQGWETRVYSKTDASELRFRSSFNPTILHVTSHGFFSEKDFISAMSTLDNPQFKSGFYLSGASATFNSFINKSESNTLNDGMVTTYEAMALELNRTQLVVLSAPQAGTGVDGNLEGIFGLRRAFIVAGARNLLTNFSRSDENAVTELMVLFYHKFMETESVSESLKFAQMKLRTKYADPKIWGSFMLIGNG